MTMKVVVVKKLKEFFDRKVVSNALRNESRNSFYKHFKNILICKVFNEFDFTSTTTS